MDKNLLKYPDYYLVFELQQLILIKLQAIGKIKIQKHMPLHFEKGNLLHINLMT